MPAKARIGKRNGKTYLARGRERDELQPLAASAGDLAAVAGQHVDVEVEARHTAVRLPGVDDQVRAYLLKQFVAERIIAQEVYELLVGK